MGDYSEGNIARREYIRIRQAVGSLKEREVGGKVQKLDGKFLMNTALIAKARLPLSGGHFAKNTSKWGAFTIFTNDIMCKLIRRS